jgi:hypothetical protein
MPVARDDPPRRQLGAPSAVSKLALVLMCEAVVVFGLLKEFGCLSGGSGYAAYVCTSDSAKPWFERSLALAAIIAPLGAIIGWRRRSWRTVWGAVALSLAMSIATLLWGLRTVRV